MVTIIRNKGHSSRSTQKFVLWRATENKLGDSFSSTNQQFKSLWEDKR